MGETNQGAGEVTVAEGQGEGLTLSASTLSPGLPIDRTSFR